MNIYSSYLLAGLFLAYVASYVDGSQKKYVVDPNVKTNFDRAVKYCQAKKMELATIDSEEDLENVMEVLNKTSGGKPGRFWSSGRKSSDGYWKWIVNGNKFALFNWGEGEPNNIGGQQKCMEFYVNHYRTGIYDDVECDYECPPVCQTT